MLKVISTMMIHYGMASSVSHAALAPTLPHGSVFSSLPRPITETDQSHDIIISYKYVIIQSFPTLK